MFDENKEQTQANEQENFAPAPSPANESGAAPQKNDEPAVSQPGPTYAAAPTPQAASSANTDSDPYAAPKATPYLSSYYSAPEPPKATKPAKARPGILFTVSLCLVCILLSAASGFGGAYAYKHFFGEDASDNGKGNGTANSGGKSEVIINQSTNDPTADIKEGDLTSIIDSVSKTVVEIRTEKVSYGYFIGNYVSEGAGSGVIISEDGYIITNNHVVEGADTLTVRTKAGEEFEATLIGADAQTDIAVIKIEANDLPAATLGTSSDLLVGQRSIAIGNPLGELGGTVTIGYISALDREVSIDGVKMTLLQTDAAINPGNSGGGLFDVNGRLIGVVNAKSTGSDIEGLGFAIPIDTAKEIATDILENGHVTGRPALGVKVSEVTSSNYHEFRGEPLYRYITDYGVYIVEDERGNFEYGDLIVAFNDITVSTQTDLAAALAECQIGDTVTVTVSRNRKLVRVELELVELSA